MIVKNALKKLVPALAASVAISGIYMGVAKADNIFDVIYITDVDDVIEVGAGYYENSTIIQNDIPTPTAITADTYADGKNDTIAEKPITTSTELLIANKRGERNDISLGVDEQLTLSPGYYYSPVTVKNGVEHKKDFNIILDNPDNLSYSIEEGYYTNGKVSVSPDFDEVKDALYKLMESRFTYGMSFKEIATAINSISRNAKAEAEYAKNEQKESTSLGAEESEKKAITLVDEEGGQKLSLGVDEKLTILGGYYSDDFVIENGVADRGNGDATIDGNKQTVELKEGYYSDSTISLSNTWYDLVDAINNTFGATLSGDISFAELAQMLSGDKYQNNKKGTATFTEKTTGENERIGTSSDNPTLSDVELAGKNIELGIDETLVIPAGYYGSDITITNGIVHRENIDTTVSAFNNKLQGGEKTATGEAGYYDSIKVSDATPNGTITKSSINGTKSTWDSISGSWKN